jgi:hypothetical protein
MLHIMLAQAAAAALQALADLAHSEQVMAAQAQRPALMQLLILAQVAVVAAQVFPAVNL